MATVDRLVQGAPTLDDLRARVQDEPGALEPMRALGWALYGLERYQEAVESLREAHRKYPDDAETGYALGLALKQVGEDQEARKAFETVLDHLDTLEGDIRSDMMKKLAKGQINVLDHGSWDIGQV
jgi:tetratricopeptide (TPR) repeat protein